MLSCDVHQSWSDVAKASRRENEEKARLAAQLLKLERKLQQDFLAAMEKLSGRVDIKKLAKLLSEGKINDAIELVNQQAIAAGIRPIATSTTEATVLAGRAAVASIDIPDTLEIAFRVTNPKTIDHLRRYEFNLIREMTAHARATIRDTITDGMSRGLNPLTIARDVKANIKLTREQARFVRNYRAELENLSSASLRRALRDKRFDRTIRAAIENDEGISQAQIDKMVAAYQRKYTQYRAQTIARTEATRANNLGNQEGWRQAVEDGAMDATEVRRFWIYTKDKKTRDSHKRIPKLNPDGVGLDEPFKSDLGDIMFPGDPDADVANTANCRCALFLKYVPARLRR